MTCSELTGPSSDEPAWSLTSPRTNLSVASILQLSTRHGGCNLYITLHYVGNDYNYILWIKITSYVHTMVDIIYDCQTDPLSPIFYFPNGDRPLLQGTCSNHHLDHTATLFTASPIANTMSKPSLPGSDHYLPQTPTNTHVVMLIQYRSRSVDERSDSHYFKTRSEVEPSQDVNVPQILY